MKRKVIISCFALLFLFAPIFFRQLTAQATSGPTLLPTTMPALTPTPTGQPGSPAPSPQQTVVAKVPVPEEYTYEEFTPWMRDLRRAEIIFFGSLPYTFFVVTELYDTYRLTYYGIADGVWDVRYAPWPFSVPERIVYEDGEKVGILISALTLAVLTAAADYLIGRLTDRKLGEKRIR